MRACSAPDKKETNTQGHEVLGGPLPAGALWNISPIPGARLDEASKLGAGLHA